MGSKNSKETEQATTEQNFLRNPSKRASRRQRASSISLGLKQLRQQIDEFDGYREDPRYSTFQSVLTKSSQDIQGLKHKSKADTQQFCDNVQADIIDLIRLLEQVVSKNERDLDSGAVESHSFINQMPHLQKKETVTVVQEINDASPERSDNKSDTPSYNRNDITDKPEHSRKYIKNSERMTSLDQLEQATSKLQQEISNAISLEDTKQFFILEKKIRLIYTDLEMIEVEEHTPLHEKKESLSRKLIRYNNRIKKAKLKLASQVDVSRPMNEEEKKRKAQNELEVIIPIQRELEDLEVKVLTFDDVKGTTKYKELDQTLKSYWATLQDLEDSTDTNRRRKLKTIDLIKKILQELNNRAEENSAKIKVALEKISSIEEDVFGLKKSAEEFDGTRNDPKFKQVDQKLRSLWAKLNDVHGAYEKVEKKKEETIMHIQSMLKALLENAQNNEQKISEENSSMLKSHVDSNGIEEKPLNDAKALQDQVISEENFLKQTKELQGHWNDINKAITQKLSSNEKNDIVKILDALSIEINRKIREIQILSTNSFRGYEDIRQKHQNGIIGTTVNQTINQTPPITIEVSYNQNEEKAPYITSHTNNSQNGEKAPPVTSQINNTQNGEKAPPVGSRISNTQNGENSPPRSSSENIKKIDENAGFQPQNQLVDELANSLSISTQQIEIKTLPTTAIFGQIQKIQSSLKEIKSQIKTYKGTKEDQEYFEYESKLFEHQAALENIPTNLSQIVDKARIKALNTIQECFKLLKEKVTENKQKIAETIEKKMLEERNQTELLHYNKPSEEDERQGLEESKKLKDTVARLQKLKKKVDCFNGTYKNIQYVQIEKELNSCLDELELLDAKGTEKVANNIAQLKQKVVQYLKILDERSLKVSSQEDLTGPTPKELPYTQINDLRTKLTNIKTAMENFVGQYKDEHYVRLEQELVDSKKDLDGISDINVSITAAKKQYGDYIEQLLIYFQEKVVADNEEVGGKTSRDPAKLLTQYEQEIASLRIQINALDHTLTEAQYYELDENLLQVMLKIDDIEIQDESLRDLRRRLIEDIQTLLNNLQSKKSYSSRSSATDNHISVIKIQEIEGDIREISDRINKFPEQDYDKEYDSLDEAMSSVFLQIQSIETKGNPRIIEACEALIKDVQNYKKILNQKMEEIGLEKYTAKLGTEV